MLSLRQGQRLTQQLAPAMRQSIKVLAMNLQELRQEIVTQIGQNPMIDEVEHSLEVPMDVAETSASAKDESISEAMPYDEAAPSVNSDEDAAERRQRFFDNQVCKETLQGHLERQLELSDVPAEDRPLAEMLIGQLDDNGYFTGSLPDIVMVSGTDEAHVLKVLSCIRKLDPAGCGSRSLRECLLAQMDTLEDSPWEDEVRRLVENHLEDIAAGNEGKILQALGITHEEYAKALAVLRTLEAKPGRAYEGAGMANRIVKPEVHAVREGGRWVAEVDGRSLPDIHISKTYLKMLEDPSTPREAKEYLRERLAAAQQLMDSIEHREETIRKIAQEIFDRQPGFFTDGLKGLRPLTMLEVAEKVGVHPTTVSRTVNDKYASTPRGTIELRHFFKQGIETAGGDVVTKEAVYDDLRRLIDGEDKAHPFSDEVLSAKLKEHGYPVARRTVAKYREAIGIPGASERHRKA